MASTSAATANTGIRRKETHRKYQHTFKLQVIIYAEEHTKRASARHFDIDESLVRRWTKQKTEIKEIVSKGGLGAKSSRVKKGGRKAASMKMEEELVAWVQSKRSDSIRLTTRMVRKKALDLVAGDAEIRDDLDRNLDRNVQSFGGSRGWMRRFFKRNGFSIRRRTTQG